MVEAWALQRAVDLVVFSAPEADPGSPSLIPRTGKTAS
jgi:hypothetical protein